MGPLSTAYVATPAIVLDGQVDTGAVGDLMALVVEETTTGMSWCEATFGNWGMRDSVPGYRYLSGDPIDFGTALAVSFCTDGTDRRVFDGKVSAVQADYPADRPVRVRVFAEDRLQDLRLTRRTRTFDESSTADIVGRVAQEHGLTADADLDGPVRKVTAQLNQSDLAFLRALARSDDAELWLDDTTLRLRRRPDRDAPTVRLDYGGDLLSFSVRADLAHQVTEVAVTGWSVADKAAVHESADALDLAAELGPGERSGSALLASAFAERSERIVRSVPLAADDARALARAAYLERARRFVCGTGTTAGDPALRVGVRVALSGLGGLFDGEYAVCRVRHEYGLAQGYRTEFDVERAGLETPR
ncbi:contractile injection system protein, VgrG/Pvc8 family [Streptomyces sp. NPDC002588]|uniref:phage late control D family protein n=1 Tax=Streptomyces sp. NPDC002588 TaxID=3154419 RepID=UPI003325F080